MRREDMFGGVAVDQTATSSFEQSDEMFAAEQANFGQFIYGPQQTFIQPGIGGMNPYYQSSQQTYHNGGNPAFQFMYQNGMMQMPQGDITYEVEPITFGNEYLPPAGYEEKITELQMQYFMDMNNQEAKNIANQIAAGQNNAYYNPYGGMNYYGQPYYSNPYQYNYYVGEYGDQLEEMRVEAKERRTNLNMKLSRLARNISGQEVNEQNLHDMYHGKMVTIPGVTYQDVYNEQRFSNLVPFDNSDYYRRQQLEASARFHKFVKPDSDLKETFENMPLVMVDYELEEEKHRRRARIKDTYDSSTYRDLILSKAVKDYAKENGIPLQGDPNFANSQSGDILTMKFQQMKQGLSQMFPTMSAHTTFADDGTVSINYSVENIMEQQNAQNVERFNNFLNTIHDSVQPN